MSQHVVIIGANRGIGLALTKKFSLLGYQVTAACRKSSAELEALSVKVIEQVDIATDKGIKRLTEQCVDVSINLLVCNAGILRDESLGDLNLETIRQQFEVNALAPLRLVDALEANLADSGKVAMITSRMGSIADNGSGGRYGYRMSKAALNAASMSLSKDLANRNIAVGIYHPGYVQTDMVGGHGDISAELAAERLVNLMLELSMAETGEFKHSNGQTLPW